MVARWQSTMRDGDVGGEPRRLVAALLDRVEGFRLMGLSGGIGGVEVSDPGVEIPAEVVESLLDLRDLGEAPLLEVLEADDHVRYLDPGVVDVVLDPTSNPRWRRSRTNVSPRQALRRWPIWAALLGLMLVCSTTTRPRGRGGGGVAREEAGVKLARKRAAVEEEVHVAAPGDLRPPDAGRRRQRRRQALGDLAGLLPQGLGEVERGGEGQVAQLDAGRVLERHRGQLGAEIGSHGRLDAGGEARLKGEHHTMSE